MVVFFLLSFCFVCGQSWRRRREKEKGGMKSLGQVVRGRSVKVSLSVCVCVCFVLELIHTLCLRFCFSLKWTAATRTNLGRLVGGAMLVWSSNLTSNILYYQANGNEWTFPIGQIKPNTKWAFGLTPEKEIQRATLNELINRTLADHRFLDKEESWSQDEGPFLVVGIASF